MSELGRTIRACRLGWYVADGMHAWMRVSDGKHGCIVVDLAPLDNIPPAHGIGKEYRCIGSGSGGSHVDSELIALSPVLSAIKRVKRQLRLVLTEHGHMANPHPYGAGDG
jgi:hypothetical protein